MACKRSAVRSRLAPPRFAFGYAWRSHVVAEGEAYPAKPPWAKTGCQTLPDIIIHHQHIPVMRGAATQEPEGRSVPGEAPLGEDGLERPPDTIYHLGPPSCERPCGTSTSSAASIFRNRNTSAQLRI